MDWRFGILWISDRGARGEREDQSRGIITELLEKRIGGRVVTYKVVPDEIETIKETMIDMIERDGVDLIVTTGGTGLGPRDVTPEATLQIVDRVIPGFAEEMRRRASQVSPNELFSRAVIGTRKRTLIVNLPGAPRSAEICLSAILEFIPPALELLAGKRG
ncbi:MAG: MogA/MoaB family molybdenum cofactor biosynthesis protein [Hydrogenibacillus schlegelii]|nr:MogA/MoaB family molybdenum cofactor biosynthesis protein [Hydrogenibacillus schlegelii]